jgi:hypothetical protein
MLVKIRKMKSLSDDDEVAYTQESGSESSGASAQPAWMRALYSSVDNWLNILPKVSFVLLILISLNLNINTNRHIQLFFFFFYSL